MLPVYERDPQHMQTAIEAIWQNALQDRKLPMDNQGLAACTFVARGALQQAGKRWLQGPRRPALDCQIDHPLAHLLAQRHVYRVEAHVAEGLLAWTHGRRKLELLFEIPTPARVLHLQARGMRCVSLLPDGADTALQANAFEFALHDLCHVEKFVDPAHYLGQVGFFSLVDAATQNATWRQMTQKFDAQWLADFDHVAADMNGSVLFLFSALRRKWQLACERANLPAKRAAIFDFLGLNGDALRAAADFSVHPDVDPRTVQHNASQLLLYFENVGQAKLGLDLV